MVAIAGSARGGERFERRQLDTLGSLRAVSECGTPVLFLHGTRDANVAVEIPIYLYQVGDSPARFQNFAPTSRPELPVRRPERLSPSRSV